MSSGAFGQLYGTESARPGLRTAVQAGLVAALALSVVLPSVKALLRK